MLETLLCYLTSDKMLTKIITLVVTSFFLLGPWGNGYKPMDPVEFAMYLDDNDNVILEVPEATGFSYDEGMFNPLGYNVTPMVNQLKDDYGICIDTDSTVTTTVTGTRSNDPVEVDVLMESIFLQDQPYFPWGYFVKIHHPPYQPKSLYSRYLGFGGFNVTLNTIECEN